MHMSRDRYTATNLKAVLEDRERTVAWLARKCNVSYALMNYISRNERTASHKVAESAAEALNVPLFLIFESTSVVRSNADMEAVA